MLNIYQNQTNILIISDLVSKTTIINPFYIFNFVDIYNRSFVKSFTDYTDASTRYSKFYYTDSSDGTLTANGIAYIYENTTDASVIDASMNLLVSESYSYYPLATQDFVFEPSIYNVDGVDFVFSPIFNTSTTPLPTSFAHNLLIERDASDAHPQYILESSLGPSFTYGDGSLGINLINNETFLIALSGENDNLTADGSAVTFAMPFNFTLTELIATVKDAPIGSDIMINLKKNDDVSVLNDLLSIDISSLTSVGSASPYSIIDPSFNKGDIVYVPVEQIGMSIPGKGLKLIMNGIKN